MTFGTKKPTDGEIDRIPLSISPIFLLAKTEFFNSADN